MSIKLKHCPECDNMIFGYQKKCSMCRKGVTEYELYLIQFRGYRLNDILEIREHLELFKRLDKL